MRKDDSSGQKTWPPGIWIAKAGIGILMVIPPHEKSLLVAWAPATDAEPDLKI
jgi:hypothetical protein